MTMYLHVALLVLTPDQVVMKKLEFTNYVQTALSSMKSVPFTENGTALCWMNSTSFGLACCSGLRNALEERDPPAPRTRLFMMARLIRLYEEAFHTICVDAELDKTRKASLQSKLNEHRGTWYNSGRS